MSVIRLKNKKKPNHEEASSLTEALVESMDFVKMAEIGRSLGHTYGKPVTALAMEQCVRDLLAGLFYDWEAGYTASTGRFMVMLIDNKKEVRVSYTPFESSAYIYDNGDVGIVGETK